MKSHAPIYGLQQIINIWFICAVDVLNDLLQLQVTGEMKQDLLNAVFCLDAFCFTDGFCVVNEF